MNLAGWLAVCRRAWGRAGQDAAERERAEVGEPIRPTQDRKPRTRLGERYRRLVRRRGKLKALVAVARTILVIIWHLLADRPRATTTSEPATTPAVPAPTAGPAITSATSRPWALPSPSPPPPDPYSQAGAAVRCRAFS